MNRLIRLGIATAACFLTVLAVAFGDLKPGFYLGNVKGSDNVSFQVKGGDVKDFTVSSKKCGPGHGEYYYATIKKMGISNKGKFDGDTATPSGGKLEVSGKETSNTKAEGHFTIKGCEQGVAWTAKRSTEGG